MTNQEARNLLPGDTVDYVVGEDWDTGYVKEVRSHKDTVRVIVRNEQGYGNEALWPRQIIALKTSALRKPTPSIKACRDMKRGYIS